MEIISLINRPEMKGCMAEWFYEKWGIAGELLNFVCEDME